MFAGGIPYMKKPRPPSIQFCTVREADGKLCGRPALANGVCSRHYHRAYWHRRKVKGLGAWTPRIIVGEGRHISHANRVPDHYPERQEFRLGFEAGLDGRPPRAPRVGTVSSRDFVKGGMRPEDHLPHATIEQMTPEWRTGYAVGRECRGDAKMIAAVYEAIRHKPYATVPGATRERGIQKLIARVRGEKGPSLFKHVGGPRMSVKSLCAHFANRDTPAHSSGGAWTDGVTFYSYNQPVAQKDRRSVMGQIHERIVAVDPRVFSNTTTRHQTWVGGALRRAGWTVEYRNLGGPKRR